ncbi:MAG: CopG family transcriptional regulator [Burkholderiales bacterium]|nr:CopG family transcriptional regulator [Burkholderiales bacterium]
MTITVRLDPALATALDEACAAQGVTKSLVVQEALTAYLAQAAPAPASDKKRPPASSANLKAFVDAGLVGCITGTGGPADKAAVRAAALARIGTKPAA